MEQTKVNIRVRILQIVFDQAIKAYEIPAFRAAVAQFAGFDNALFHNHLSENSLRYKYPLIQYKRIGSKPAIICIEQGVEEIHHFFENTYMKLRIGERTVSLKIENLRLNQFVLNVWDKKFHYRINNWIALNQENYTRYQQIRSSKAQLEFLEKKLTANILAFAKGVNWFITKPIELTITKKKESRSAKFKGQNLIGFNLDFTTNVFLPNYIGLGKGVSHGYGVVMENKKN